MKGNNYRWISCGSKVDLIVTLAASDLDRPASRTLTNKMTNTDRLSVMIRRGASVNYAGFFAGKLIVFVNSAILARLLAPEQFGLVAIGLLVLSISEAITEAGPSAAVVWRTGPLEDTAPVALALSVISAVLMALATFLAAPTVARFFDEPQAAGIIQVFALCILLSSPAAVFSGILQRHMAFGKRLFIDVSRALTKGAIGIPLALAGYDVWSLVYGQVAAVVIGLGLAIWLSGWMPRMSLERRTVAQILPYASHIAVIGLIGVAIKKTDIVIVGARFDAAQLGFYTLAFSLVELVTLGICWSASQALFPVFSQAAQKEGLDHVFTKGLATLLAVTFPISVGTAVLAEPFLLSVYGAKWAPAVPLLQIFSFYALIYSTAFNLGDIYKASGRPHLLSRINLANLILAVPLFLIGAQWGILGIAWAQVFVATSIAALNWAVAWRLAGIGPNVLWHAARVPAVASFAAAVVCIVTEQLPLGALSAPVRLGLFGLLGAVSYGCVFLALLRLSPLASTWRPSQQNARNGVSASEGNAPSKGRVK